MMYRRLLTTHAVPWRVRNGLERWVEGVCRGRLPALYRLIHFGRSADPVRAVTTGPGHHFFGYYDKSPWNEEGRHLLAHEADFNDRPPGPGDPAGIAVVDLADGNRLERLGETRAWNWQQGAMTQWHPADPSRLVVHNDIREGHCIGVVRDLERGETARYDRPVYALTPDGRTGFSLNFARLATHRPGYGYAGLADPFADDPRPDRDGIWRMDLASGESRLLVSVAELAARDPRPSMSGAWHYLNHIQVSPGGARLAFFHLWHREPGKWEVRLYSCRPDGGALTCLLDTGFISHYDWRDEDRILVWANRPSGGPRFLLLSHDGSDLEVFAGDRLTEDGHCSYSPDRRWVLNDTYPDVHQMRTLMLVGTADGRRIDVARLHSPKSRWWGEIRCDLHPRWSRDGTQACIDSVHEGTRQIYVVDLKDFLD